MSLILLPSYRAARCALHNYCIRCVSITPRYEGGENCIVRKVRTTPLYYGKVVQLSGGPHSWIYLTACAIAFRGLYNEYGS